MNTQTQAEAVDAALPNVEADDVARLLHGDDPPLRRDHSFSILPWFKWSPERFKTVAELRAKIVLITVRAVQQAVQARDEVVFYPAGIHAVRHEPLANAEIRLMQEVGLLRLLRDVAEIRGIEL